MFSKSHVSHEPIADKLKLRANCCSKHWRNQEFSIFGEPIGITVPVNENAIVVPREPDAEWLRSHTSCDLCAVLIKCGSCDSLTIHVYDAESGWKTISPSSWRSRVQFSWIESPDHLFSAYKMENIKAVCYKKRRRGSCGWRHAHLLATDGRFKQYCQQFKERIKRKGTTESSRSIDELVVQYLLNGIERYNYGVWTYLKALWKSYIYGSFREFCKEFDSLMVKQLTSLPDGLSDWQDLVADICNKGELCHQDRGDLVRAITEAIYALFSLRHISQSPALSEVREKLEQALRDVGETPPDLTALKKAEKKAAKG